MSTYHGQILWDENGESILVQGALSAQHPEFGNRVPVIVEVTAPGELRVHVEQNGLGECDVEDDPALVPFLSLLEQDMAGRPEAIRPLDEGLVGRARELVRDVCVDPDEELPSDFRI